MTPFNDDWQSEAFDRADPPTKSLLNATANATRIVKELQMIRWLLLVLVVIAFTALQRTWPDWWHTPWWPQ